MAGDSLHRRERGRVSDSAGFDLLFDHGLALRGEVAGLRGFRRRAGGKKNGEEDEESFNRSPHPL